jgi:hypothetical protein
VARHYVTAGAGLLVCPTLIQRDARHGIAHNAWPPCWRESVDRDGYLVDHHGKQVRDHRDRPQKRCTIDHEHGTELEDLEGHATVVFGWIPGCRPPTAEEWPTCQACGSRLVHTAGDHPLDERHTAELEAITDEANQAFQARHRGPG